MDDLAPVVGMRWETTVSTSDVLVGTMRFAPRMAGPPVHTHPAEESFQVVEGTIEVLIEKKWRPVAAGETAVVPEGVRHSVRNLSAAPATVVNTHRPPQRMEALFNDVAVLEEAGKIKRLPPRDPRTAIYAAMVITKYAESMVVVAPQRQAFRVLTWLGRALRWRV